MFNLGLRCICLRLFLDRIISGKANTTNISISPPFGDGTSITFYAMCDAPYTDHERENILPYQMQNLSDSAAFLVHLGDLQSRRVDECQEYAYQTASDILKQSRIPVFVIPGGECLLLLPFACPFLDIDPYLSSSQHLSCLAITQTTTSTTVMILSMDKSSG